MEEFLYWEDRPAYPWSCFIYLKFSGVLDQKAFEAAVNAVIARHPLFSAKVDKKPWRRMRWAGVDIPQPRVKWELSPIDENIPPAERLDLDCEIGIRFHVRNDGVNSDLTIQFHHSCCDGAGIFQFIKELLIAYAAEFAGKLDQVEFSALDPKKLTKRGRYGLTPMKLLRMLPKQFVGLAGARQFLMRSPVPLVPHHACGDDSPLPTNYPATVRRLLDRETTSKLRKAAMRLGVTSNDLLARDLFLAIDDWRTQENIPDDGSWLRMMIPMNLRTTEDRLLPAAHLVSSVFLDRRKQDFADSDRLLQSVHEEMDLIKRMQLGLTFIFSTALCRRFFGGLKRKVRADKCTISCIFTNLGMLLAHVPLPRNEKDNLIAGNVTLENIDIVAPVRPYSCVTVAVGIYARKLGITLHYDPRPLTEEQADKLLELFVERIRASLAG
jgi:NRPS condensation-like uncharacterized protein